jgi:trans-2,3-dihydro-3-hydroxyanthranilate isomerase
MPRRYVTCDVFTDTPFGGNPLAVVLDAEGLSAAQMQAIAREFGYSETTFVLPPRDAVNTAWVRIFTPTREIPFAGHPNVGTAWVLAREIEARGGKCPERFVFEEGAGPVAVALRQQDGRVRATELTAPQALSLAAEVSPVDAAACLGLGAEAIRVDTHPPRVASVGLPFLIVELVSREALRRVRADMAVHARVLPPIGVDGAFAYVRSGQDSTLHARMFAPLDAMPEDPATGSATAATIAWLAALDGGADGARDWRVHQGEDMGRPSLLLGRSVRRAGAVVSIHVGGSTVVMMEGALHL